MHTSTAATSISMICEAALPLALGLNHRPIPCNELQLVAHFPFTATPATSSIYASSMATAMSRSLNSVSTAPHHRVLHFWHRLPCFGQPPPLPASAASSMACSIGPRKKQIAPDPIMVAVAVASSAPNCTMSGILAVVALPLPYWHHRLFGWPVFFVRLLF
jgi:hypothetical protein